LNNKKHTTRGLELLERINRLGEGVEWSNEELREALREEGVDPENLVRSVLSSVSPLLSGSASEERVTLDSCGLDRSLLGRLRKAGIDRQLLRRLPCQANVESKSGRTSENGPGLAIKAAQTISRVFGWAPELILNPAAQLELDPTVIATACFKLPRRANVQRVRAYTVYAHTLALILLDATRDLPHGSIPTSAEDLSSDIKAQYGSVSFENALRYAWSLGIPVLPLSDSGAFHAACWREKGRNIIVLKQPVRSLARWLYDLIHELCHAGRNPKEPRRSVVEYEKLEGKRLSPEEKEANQIAGDVILDGRAEQLAKMCVVAAQGKVEWLKRVVPMVAKREHVATDALANYMAFRLSLEGVNWWGTATGLQNTDVDPWQLARNVLKERIDFSSLSYLDLVLLEQALIDDWELEA
jgi:hypothetical protein